MSRWPASTVLALMTNPVGTYRSGELQLQQSRSLNRQYLSEEEREACLEHLMAGKQPVIMERALPDRSTFAAGHVWTTILQYLGTLRLGNGYRRPYAVACEIINKRGPDVDRNVPAETWARHDTWVMETGWRRPPGKHSAFRRPAGIRVSHLVSRLAGQKDVRGRR